jgi:hypothetical protein
MHNSSVGNEPNGDDSVDHNDAGIDRPIRVNVDLIGGYTSSGKDLMMSCST